MPAYSVTTLKINLAAPVARSWTGQGDGIHWTDASNWAGNSLPTASDDVFINVAASNPTIDVSGVQTVRSINSNETLHISGSLSITGINPVSRVTALSLDANATLDLRDTNLIIDYTGASTLAATQALINAARNGGGWTGAGITSTSARDNPLHNTTLGAMEATDYKSIYGAGATFGGAAIDNTAVLVKYTYYGDADFNGVVNFDDYSRIDAGFNNSRSGWLNGDFDGNGIVDFDDYALIDLAFNSQSGARATDVKCWPESPAVAFIILRQTGFLRVHLRWHAVDFCVNRALRAVSTSHLPGSRHMSHRIVRSQVELLESRRLLSAILRVDANSDATQPDGLSWITAFPDLQQALAVATAGDQIRVADGTYRPTTTNDRTISFELKDGFSIFGGYAGIGAPNPDQRDIALFATILSGNIGDANTALDNSYHVVIAQAEEFAFEPIQVLLDGVTVRDGRADNVDIGVVGAGMSAHNASATIANCTFANNSAIGGGGGLYVSHTGEIQPHTTITDCTFVGNAGLEIDPSPYIVTGGAVFISGGCVIERSLFQENIAPLGGAIYRTGDGECSVRDSTFLRNSAFTGGAILAEGRGRPFSIPASMAIARGLGARCASATRPHQHRSLIANSSATWLTAPSCSAAARSI